jgi:HK97 family phage portal protein
VRRDTRGKIIELIPLDAARIVISRNARGRLDFDYNTETASYKFGQEQIWRIAGMGKDGVVGLSPISLARESLGIAVSAERSAGKLFSNGNQSQIALEFPSMMTQEQADRLREQWASQYAGTDNAHKPVILEGGMSAKSLGMTAGDAQFLESRKWQIAEIARWFRVPLHMLNELDRATFSNIEHQSIEFVQHTIRPWLVRIEQTISRDLLNNEERQLGYYVAHSVEGILRGDTASRYDAYGKAINDGWMSRNEVRKLENLNAADGLDEYLTPLNMAIAGESEQADPVDEVANAENKVLKLESGRELGDFANWCVKFFDRQERRLAEAGIPHEGYAEKRIARIASLDSVDAAIDELVAHTKFDIEAQSNE